MITKEFIMGFLEDARVYEAQRDDYEIDAFWRIRDAAATLLLKHFGIYAQQKSIKTLMEELRDAS